MAPPSIGWTNSRTRLLSGVAGDIELIGVPLGCPTERPKLQFVFRVPAAGFEPGTSASPHRGHAARHGHRSASSVQLAPAAISSVDIRQATTAVGKWADTC